MMYIEFIKKGKKVAMIGVENAYPIGLDTSNVRKVLGKRCKIHVFSP